MEYSKYLKSKITKATLASCFQQNLLNDLDIEVDMKTSKKIIDCFIDTIKEELMRDTILISGFGEFSLSQVPQRMGMNPKTGQKMVIKAHVLPRFKASLAFKKIYN